MKKMFKLGLLKKARAYHIKKYLLWKFSEYNRLSKMKKRNRVVA